MRLQLALVLLARVASADPAVSAAARVSVYSDDDHTNIVTATVGASGNVARDVRVDAQYLVDAVSSASVDVITAATGRIHDVRSEVTTGVTYGQERSLRASYIYSTEHDWSSHTFSLGGTYDVLQHNLTLGVSGTLGTNEIHRMGDADFRARLTTGGLEAYYLRFLNDPTDAEIDRYQETRQGRDALAALDWAQVFAYEPTGIAFARSLFDDLADALGIQSPFPGPCHPLTERRANGALRNL